MSSGERLSVGGSDSPRLKVSRKVVPTLLAGQRCSPLISVNLSRGFTSPEVPSSVVRVDD